MKDLNKRFNCMTNFRQAWLIVGFIAFCFTGLDAQKESPNLTECVSLARENYPMTKALDLIARSHEYSMDNLS